ncbi:class F sortase, partial [TM7 phylum sp. oral taxon 352]
MIQRERKINRSLQTPLRARGRVTIPRRGLASNVVANTVSNVNAKNIVDVVRPSAPAKVRQTQQSKVRPTQQYAKKPINHARINKRLARSARLLIICKKSIANGCRDGRRKHAKRYLQNILGSNFRRKVPSFAASALLIISIYSFADSWLLNNRIKNAVNATPVAARSDNLDDRKNSEGKDETKVSDDAIAKYKVAADLPRVITIEKLGVKARVLQMNVNSDGSMQSPINIFDAGWYTGSVKPGQPGASIIVGHASGTTLGGVFNKLETLNAGDTISVERGDGKILRYQVIKKQTVKL